jgi:hypothetical protein
MASDIVLVLKSEHRDLLILAEQCGRMSRGFHDPVAELRRRLQVHLAVSEEEVLPVVRSSSSEGPPGLLGAVARVGAALADEASGRDELALAARVLVEAERSDVLPVVAAKVPIPERRRMGKIFRMRREALLRAAHAPTNRRRSQTELYELARRAGLEHRSTMTQAQLQAAVVEWERQGGQAVKSVG